MKKHISHRAGARARMASLLAIIAVGPALARFPSPVHAAVARIAPYLMASKQREIALARTAAPASVSMHATVMVLGDRGYVTAAKGNNGFVCLVMRSWDNSVSVKSVTFWDPKFHVPNCFNAAAARTVLPEYLMKTRWAIAGDDRAEIADREKAARAAGKLEKPAAGALCYMMSKRSWGVGGQPGPWRPHLMFYFPRARTPDWGANLNGNPVFAGAADHATVFFVLVPVWSDGTPAPRFE